MRTATTGARLRHMNQTSLSTEELIALGRDREAVAAAAADGRSRGSEGVAQLREVIALLTALVTELTPVQLSGPTPCSAFTVGGVLQHMVDGATAFAPAFRGVAATAPTDETGQVTVRWQAAMADLLDAVQSPGALERSIATPFGVMPGDQFARYVAFDGLMHGWDLATATGQPYAPRDALVAAIDGYARQVITDELRDGDTFAAQTAPVDDTPLAQLVAFSGRSATR